MTWLTWRQFRLSFAAVFVFVAVVGVVVAATRVGVDVVGQGETSARQVPGGVSTEYRVVPAAAALPRVFEVAVDQLARPA